MSKHIAARLAARPRKTSLDVRQHDIKSVDTCCPFEHVEIQTGLGSQPELCAGKSDAKRSRVRPTRMGACLRVAGRCQSMWEFGSHRHWGSCSGPECHHAIPKASPDVTSSCKEIATALMLVAAFHSRPCACSREGPHRTHLTPWKHAYLATGRSNFGTSRFVRQCRRLLFDGTTPTCYR